MSAEEYLPFTLAKGKLLAKWVAVGQKRGSNAMEPHDPVTIWGESDTLFVWIPDAQAWLRSVRHGVARPHQPVYPTGGRPASIAFGVSVPETGRLR